MFCVTNRLVKTRKRAIIGDPMGLQLYIADYARPHSDEETDVDGQRALHFEMLRALSDVARVRVVGKNGDSQIKLGISPHDVQSVCEQIRKAVPRHFLNGFSQVINNYAASANDNLMRCNGHGSLAERTIVQVSLKLNDALRVLFVAVVTGDEPIIESDLPDDERSRALCEIADEDDPELHTGWSQPIEGCEIISECDGDDDEMDEDDDDDSPWSVDTDFWKPDDSGGSDKEDWNEANLQTKTPDPIDIDPETEALILSEASEVIMSMEIIINDFQEMLETFEDLYNEDLLDNDVDAYQETIIEVMRSIEERMGTMVNLECVVAALEHPESLAIMQHLNELQRMGCIGSIFHNVAEAALMQVDRFSNMVSAMAADEDEDNERSLHLILTFIERLRERHGLSQ